MFTRTRRIMQNNMRMMLMMMFSIILSLPSHAEDGADRFQPWGVGIYTTNDAGTLYDHARWDWMIVRFTGDPTNDSEWIERLNEFLKVNPDQKYLIRLTPNIQTPDGAHLNFLHYRYDPAIRESVRRQVRDQIMLLQERLDKPENVVGYTFMEELPGHFGFESIRLGSFGTEIPPKVAYYQDQIEIDRGQELIWDEATWRWMGATFVESLNEVHALIKEEADGAPILFWPLLGYPASDHVDAEIDFDKREPGVVAFSYADVIKPGLADGLIGVALNEEIWKQFLDVTAENDWMLVSQLSHGGYMRLRTWDQSLAMAKQAAPQNLGYFFFCEPQGQPKPLDKPDAEKVLREYDDRFVRSESVPGRGHVLKIVHPADGDRPFIHQAASYLYCVKHPTHGSKGLKVEPGQTLHWSVWAKAQDIDGIEGGVVTFVWDGSLGPGAQPTVLTVTGTHDWQKYEGTIVVPENTVGGRIYLGMRQATGVVYFDNLSITVAGSNKNLIENGLFEEMNIEGPLHWNNWIIDDHSLVLAHWRAFCEQEQVGIHLRQ